MKEGIEGRTSVRRPLGVGDVATRVAFFFSSTGTGQIPRGISGAGASEAVSRAHAQYGEHASSTSKQSGCPRCGRVVAVVVGHWKVVDKTTEQAEKGASGPSGGVRGRQAVWAGVVTVA